MTLTVIPDLHADPDRLARSLSLAEGQVAFLGDFIDAGRASREADDRSVLTEVRALVDAGAPAVMGNHELNAILFHRKGPDGDPLRPHVAKNLNQHRSFLAAFGTGTLDALEWTEWFLTLPLWCDVGGLRLVHACWNDAAIATITARRPDGRLRHEDLPEIAEKATEFARAVNLLVTGPEVSLPAPHRFHDYHGHVRNEVRLAWWVSGAQTWAEAVLSVPDPGELPSGTLPDLAADLLYPASSAPALVGHYKMSGEPRIESRRVACLDYPFAPCLYRWQGERDLDPANLVLL